MLDIFISYLIIFIEGNFMSPQELDQKLKSLYEEILVDLDNLEDIKEIANKLATYERLWRKLNENNNQCDRGR
jgi:DNA-binding transcriptional ArsR family regulator